MIKRALSLLIILGFTSSFKVYAQPAGAMPASDPSREFISSCTYGVMAGTLVGVASLAFVDKPSDNMNRVARGASIGLYTGILLGLYVVYVVPSMESEEEDPVAKIDQLPFRLAPTFDKNGTSVDGMVADVTLMRW